MIKNKLQKILNPHKNWVMTPIIYEKLLTDLQSLFYEELNTNDKKKK